MFQKIIFLFTVLVFFAFCSAKKDVNTTRPLKIPEGKSIGVISHKYDNCGAVVIVKDGTNELVLIPFPALDKSLDSEGITIIFNYRKLRMPHPDVCQTGIMAELSDIQKSN